MTADPCRGDLGFHGNPAIPAPWLDALSAQSARLEPVYASPVCTPTRAALLTKRASPRTRALDPHRGRALLKPQR